MTTHHRALAGALLMLLSGLAAYPAEAETSTTACEASGPAPSCTFSCPEGRHLRIYAEAPGFSGMLDATAACGGATAECSDYGACQTLSPDSASSAATGTCAAGGAARFVACEVIFVESEGSSCTEHSPDYWTCGFTCTAGERLHVSATTTGPNPSSEWPRLHAACGGVDILCQSNARCEASGGTVLYNDTGVCRAETVYVSGTCSSGAQPPPPPPPRRRVGTSIPTAGVGPMAPIPLWTPGIGTLCAPSGLVCAGPVERREVGSTPGTPPVRTPSGRVDVDYTDTRTPGVATTHVDPVVAPTPVPITVCAFGCDVPSGTSGPLVVAANVTVVLGNETVERRVEAP